jgi:hypothetical protein
MKAGKEMEWKK